MSRQRLMVRVAGREEEEEEAWIDRPAEVSLGSTVRDPTGGGASKRASAKSVSFFFFQP